MQQVKECCLPSTRIQALFDGISSIAMTLLVMNIQLPELAPEMDNAALINLLHSMTPRFYVFILSFLLLASLWKVHQQQYRWIEKIDGNLLRINFLWQLFIVLVPFSASLVGKYGHNTAGSFVFHGNLLAVGLLSWLSWYYALKNNLLEPSIPKREIHYNLYSVLVLPITALTALVACFWTPSGSSLIYLLIIPLRLVMNRTIR